MTFGQVLWICLAVSGLAIETGEPVAPRFFPAGTNHKALHTAVPLNGRALARSSKFLLSPSSLGTAEEEKAGKVEKRQVVEEEALREEEVAAAEGTSNKEKASQKEKVSSKEATSNSKRGEKGRKREESSSDKFDSLEDVKDFDKLSNVDASDVHAAATRDYNDMARKIAHAEEDFPRRTARDFWYMKDSFLPGINPGFLVFKIVIAIMSIFTLFCYVYMRYIYQHDRVEHIHRWEKELDEANFEQEVFGLVSESKYIGEELKPDIIVVFHDPTHAHDDHDDVIEREDLRRCLCQRNTQATCFLPLEIGGFAILNDLGEAPTISHAQTEERVQLTPRGSKRMHLSSGSAEHKTTPHLFERRKRLYRLELPQGVTPQMVRSASPDMVAGDEGIYYCFTRSTDEPRREHANWGLEVEGEPDPDGGWVKVTIVAEPDDFLRFTSLAKFGDQSPVCNGQALTMRTARVALFQDFYGHVPAQGFDEKVFRSVDQDEFFLCISLVKSALADHWLRRNNSELQIHRSVVGALGIHQPEGEPASSAPYVRYDPNLVEALYKAHVINKNDPKQLYVTFFGRDSDGSVINGFERIRVIFRELSSYVNLDQLKRSGLIVDWFPVHNIPWVQALAVSWAGPRRFLDFSFVQPLTSIRNYFGSRLTFFFAWNGTYCKLLTLLLAGLLMVEVALRGANLWMQIPQKELFEAKHICRSLVIITWARLAYNTWVQEEAFLLKLWNLNKETYQPIIRPEFQGTLMPSPYDLNSLDLQVPHHTAKLKKMAATFVSFLVSLGVLFLVIMWMTVFKGRLTIMSTIVLVVQISVLEVLFDKLAVKLTEWENHKFQADFTDSLVWKSFFLQAVNNYPWFLYIAVRLRFTEGGCGEKGCVALLNGQLFWTILFLSLARLLLVLADTLQVQFKLWYEMEELKKKLRPGEEVPKRSFAEEQAKYGEFRTNDTIKAFNVSFIALGFILIFGAVSPMIVPFCFLVFVVQLRATAFLLVTSTKRLVPRRALGIGAWDSVSHLLMYAGLFFGAFLLVTYGHIFKGAALTTRLSAGLLYSVAVGLAWWCVDQCMDDTDLVTLGARRDIVQRKIIHRAVDHAGLEDIAELVGEEAAMQRTMKSWQQYAAQFGKDDVDRRAVQNEDWSALKTVNQIISTRGTVSHVSHVTEAKRMKMGRSATLALVD
jgi:hypothetical protein